MKNPLVGKKVKVLTSLGKVHQRELGSTADMSAPKEGPGQRSPEPFSNHAKCKTGIDPSLQALGVEQMGMNKWILSRPKCKKGLVAQLRLLPHAFVSGFEAGPRLVPSPSLREEWRPILSLSRVNLRFKRFPKHGNPLAGFPDFCRGWACPSF